MGWRYRKSVKVFPGVRLNFSSRGVSTTVGVRGASVTFSNRGTYINTGIPGTGISHRVRVPTSSPNQPPSQYPSYILPDYRPAPVIEPEGSIKSSDAEEMTSEGLQELKTVLKEAFDERAAISAEITQTESAVTAAQQTFDKWRNNIFARYLLKSKVKQRETALEEAKAKLEELKEQRKLCTVNVDIELSEDIYRSFDVLAQACENLATCDRVWDVTAAVVLDQRATKTSYGTQVTRRPVKLAWGSVAIITSQYRPFCLANANGGDIYFYPGFLLFFSSSSSFALIAPQNVTIECFDFSFVEDEQLPRDTETIGETWERVNKNGTPDRRFANNRLLPIARYAKLSLQSAEGLNETYLFSNYEKAEQFSQAFQDYRALFQSNVTS